MLEEKEVTPLLLFLCFTFICVKIFCGLCMQINVVKSLRLSRGTSHRFDTFDKFDTFDTFYIRI